MHSHFRRLISLLLAISTLSFLLILPANWQKVSHTVALADSLPPNGKMEATAKGTPFKRMPMRFELNTGQADRRARFIARASEATVFLTPDEAVLQVTKISEPQTANRRADSQWPGLQVATLHIKTLKANPRAKITGIDRLPGKTNYFIGNDPKQWRANVPGYARVKYENLYPGIDLIYYDNEEGKLEYDFKVAAGADPGRIALSVEGAEQVRLDERGDLVMQTAIGEVRQPAPRIYQEEGGVRREVAGGYTLRQNGEVAFDVASYDTSKPLVIDPELVYATYLGGSLSSFINGVAVDAAGSVYVTGSTASANFPTKNPLQGTNRHYQTGDQTPTAFITKLTPDGSALVYSTYLGGTGPAIDQGVGIAVDATGAVYIGGNTNSRNFPTKNALQGALAGNQNLFLTKISPDGASLVYSTYLGGSGNDTAKAIALDTAGNFYIGGFTSSRDFPTRNPTQAAYGGNTVDGFISAIDSTGANLIFSTYVGNNNRDAKVYSLSVAPIAASATDSIHPNDTLNDIIAGVNETPPSDPCQRFLDNLRQTDPGRFSETIENIEQFVFLFGFSPDCNTIIELSRHDPIALVMLGILTKLPVSGDNAQHPGLQKESIQATADGVVLLQFDRNFNLAASASFGGSQVATPRAMTSDSHGAIYVTGYSGATDLPMVNPVQSSNAGGFADGFVAVFAPGSLQLVFSTYLGGSGDDEPSSIAVDPQGNIYIVGMTDSSNFPTKGAFQSNRPGPFSSFIAKISSLGQIQTGPDFSLGFDQSTVMASAPSKVKLSVNITRSGGFTGNVTITPEAVTAKGIILSTDPVATTGGSVKFKVKLKGSAQPGSYPITFTGKDDSGKTHIATVTLVIQ